MRRATTIILAFLAIQVASQAPAHAEENQNLPEMPRAVFHDDSLVNDALSDTDHRHEIAAAPACNYRVGVFTWSFRNCANRNYQVLWRPTTAPPIGSSCTTVRPGSYIYNIPRAALTFVDSFPGTCRVNIPMPLQLDE